MNNTDITNQNQLQTAVNLGFLLLLIFAFIRPLSFAFEDFAGIPIQKIFPIIHSYFLYIAVLFNLRRIKLDLISLFIFMFCAYCSLSILWGTQIVWLGRYVLPFMVFFAVRLFVKNIKEINILLIALVAGFIFPIISSFYLIFTGTSTGIVEYYSGLTRYAGIFSNVHPLAHAMTFFSYVIGFHFLHAKHKTKLFRFGMAFLLALSIYCLYKTYVRNAYLGFIIFWLILFVSVNKKYAIVFLIVLIFIVAIKSETVENIFFKGKVHKIERSLDSASSGRLTIWKHNLSIFSGLTYARKLLGLGIGVEKGILARKKDEVWPSHNDYLSILVTVGILGLICYLLIFLVLLRDVYMSGVENQIKYLFIAILFSVSTMNFVSNAYVTRIEMNQLFWFLMGIFYRLNELNGNDDNNESTIRDTNLPLGN